MLIEMMSRSLRLPPAKIQAIANGASHCYKQYYIRKRSGGQRLISHPSKVLKALQRWLLYNILRELPTHPAATAYVLGQNIAGNARRHAKSRFLLRMDIESFFPSITDDDIRRYLRKSDLPFSGWAQDDADLMCRIVCKDHRLTIGAPTSPALSNVLCLDLDTKLASLAEKNHATYTRYADDLFFSTREPNVLFGLQDEVKAIVEGTGCPGNLKINDQKTRHSSTRGRRRVTGITLTSDQKISVGRPLKRRIRSLVFNLDKLSHEERRYLAGMLAYIHDVEPNFRGVLAEKYGEDHVTSAFTPPPGD